jgi:glycosyltransferase involved in cell wall biosynthesis
VPSSVRVVALDPRGMAPGAVAQWLLAAGSLMSSDAVLVFMPSLIGAVSGVLFGKRVVAYAGASWTVRGASSWRRWLERRLARRVAVVVAHGRQLEQVFRDEGARVEPAIPLVSPDVLEAMRLPAPRKVLCERMRVLFVGSISAAKGVPELLDALRLVHVEARFVGAPEDVALWRQLEELAAGTTTMRVDGYLDWPALREAYEWADVLVLPSHSEGFPRVVYEATAFGAASVVTPVGGIPGLLAPNEEAIFVPVGDSNAIAQALRVLSEHPERRTELAEQARARFAQVLGTYDAGRKFDECLQAVLDHSKSSASAQASPSEQLR